MGIRKELNSDYNVVSKMNHPAVPSALLDKDNNPVSLGLLCKPTRFYQFKSKAGNLCHMTEIEVGVDKRTMQVFTNQLRTNPENKHFVWLKCSNDQEQTFINGRQYLKKNYDETLEYIGVKEADIFNNIDAVINR